MSIEKKYLHKEGCPWEDFHHIESIYDDNGPDFSLTISEEGLSRTDMHKSNPADIYISFNYCPCCGANLTGVEENE